MQTEQQASQEKETGRLEAFSDGVFAVAITLLALDLKVPLVQPNGTARELSDALLRQWPSYVAFATSFLTVLIMRLMLANGYLLMMTTVVPFTTELFSSYFSLPGARVAAAAYAGAFVLISIGYLWVWHAVKHGQLFRSGAPAETIDRIDRNYRYGTPMYVLATAGAAISPYVTLAICTALWLFWAFTATEC